MANVQTVGPPGGGWRPEEIIVSNCINRTGGVVNKGDVVAFDQTASDGDVSVFDPVTNNVGAENSVFRNFIQPVTAQLDNAFFGVVMEDGVADNGNCLVMLSGIVEVDVQGSNAATLADNLSAVNTSFNLSSDTVTTSKVIGRPLETTAAGTAERIWVWFSGVEGFNSPTA